MGDVLSLSTSNMIYCTVGDANFKNFNPVEHFGQLMQQMVVMDVDFSLYVRSGDCGVLYKFLV